ncbi:type III polyketide synthase [Streptomyces sp. NPDC060209]|uniref:type III polyketide synthase n=1 Tax=Streptomyces sp. NPDC060209 TaxID=3347073 RepID=UPI003660EF41
MPTVTCPHIALPENRVETDELLDHFASRYADAPRIKDALRVMEATTVASRHLSHPLLELSSSGQSVDERLDRHFADTCQLAEQAARKALRLAQLDPADIDTLVCASVTGYVMPGLDLELVNRLNLPPTTRRLPVTQMGCNGGAYALARAADLCTSAQHRILVVAADLFSSYIHPADTGMDNMIFRALMGDAAGACVVRSDDTQPGLRITATWDYTAPGTASIVGTRIRDDGMHLFNSPRLYDAVAQVLPELTGWLKESEPDSEPPTLGFLVAHPGGPKVLSTLVDGLGCDPSLIDIPWQSLRSLGNTGSVSVLDILARTYATPPPPGTHGLVIGVGPGISVTASRAQWQ